MTNSLKQSLTLILTLLLLGILATGCEETNTSNTKQFRLIAAENRTLKEQLQLKQDQLEQQEKNTEKCQQEKQALKEKPQKEAQQLGLSTLKNLQEISRLQQENKELKARVNQLETMLQQLSKELPKLETPAIPQPLQQP